MNCLVLMILSNSNSKADNFPLFVRTDTFGQYNKKSVRLRDTFVGKISITFQKYCSVHRVSEKEFTGKSVAQPNGSFAMQENA